MFKNLIGEYNHKSALLLMGGASTLEYLKILKNYDKSKFTLFVDTKALTPKFLSHNIKPDFFLAPFPEKCKDNTLQHFIYRSFLSNVNINFFLKPLFKPIATEMKKQFQNYFEVWAPHKGKHKRYKYRKDIYLKDSPYDVLKNFQDVKLITDKKLLTEHFPNFGYKNPLYFINFLVSSKGFNINNYFNPKLKGDILEIETSNFLNSSAIATYPILSAMGFKKIYLLGMDMNMLGSLEYSAPNIFKSMFHFWWFFKRSSSAFNASYKMNKPYYLRPTSEFEDLKKIFNYSNINFVRVYEPAKYVAPIDWIETINPQNLFNGVRN